MFQLRTDQAMCKTVNLGSDGSHKRVADEKRCGSLNYGYFKS